MRILVLQENIANPPKSFLMIVPNAYNDASVLFHAKKVGMIDPVIKNAPGLNVGEIEPYISLAYTFWRES